MLLRLDPPRPRPIIRQMLLYDIAYACAAPVALPLLVRKSLRTGKYRSDLAGRFGAGYALPERPRDSRLLMLHCVSVGELNSVQTLIRRLLAADPNLHLAITTTTDTGTARAQSLFPPGSNSRIHTARFPFDFSFAVESLLDRLRPDAIALVELETWPNFLSIASARRIPIALINGRISERSFPRYRFIRPLMKNMLRKIDWITAQTPAIAERFQVLGANPKTLSVLPTLKYDNAHVADHIPGQELLAAAMGLLPAHQLLVAGSTGPGEEDYLLDALQKLAPQFPNLRLSIAPRHPEVVPQVIAAIQARGLKPVLRTERPDGATNSNNEPLSGEQVFVLNTMGELRKLYALAFAAFVGRSLIKKGGGGSDMIEVTALAKPCCFGPYTQNFAEAVELLVSQDAAVETADGEALTRTLDAWLRDPSAAGALGRRAQELIRAQQGSTDQYVARLLELFRR